MKRTFAFFVVAAVGVSLVTLMDIGAFFEVLHYWKWAIPVPLALAPLSTGGHPGIKRTILAGITLWLLVLPRVPWPGPKSFWLDCARIPIGADVNDAARIMAPHSPASPIDLELVFGHSRTTGEQNLLYGDRWQSDAGWCIVRVESGRVSHVQLSHD